MQSFNKGFERPKKESAGAGRLEISGQDIIEGFYKETISKNDAVYMEEIFAYDTKLTDPAELPPSTGRGVAFSSDDTYMSVAHSTSPYITIYKRSADTFTKLTDPATLPANTGNGVAFSSDDTYMSVAHSNSPFITIYKRSADTFTKLTDPAELPPSTGRGVAFSSTDNTYMSVAHSTSPYITIYKEVNPPEIIGDNRIFKSNNDIAQLKLVDTVGAGYAQQNGILNDKKKVVRIWREV